MTKSRFPHPLALLLGGILISAALSYFLPAGEFDRREDPVTARKIVVAGSYHAVPQQPVGPFRAFVAIPKGMANAADVIFMTLLAGGAFAVVDATGALRNAVGWLVRKLQRRETLVIPIVCLLFAIGGVLENMQEEIIALVPVLLLLTRRLGFDALTAVAMSIGSACVGSSFSPMNPFQVSIAQKLAQLPLLSGAGFRSVFLVLALVVWIAGTMRHASWTRTSPGAADEAEEKLDGKMAVVLAIVLLTFVAFVYGVINLGWGFEEMGALFFIMGLAAGMIGRLGLNGTAESFVDGFRSMVYAGVVIGFARAIFVVLDEGRIVDTIVNAMVTPLANLPVAASAFGMMIMHTLVHIPVPSVSGQAVLTMPVLVPLSDLLGLSRQVTVLAYQYGAGLCELLTPTNGALMAIIAAAKVRYEDWFKFVLPVYGILFALGAIAVFAAIAIGLR